MSLASLVSNPRDPRLLFHVSDLVPDPWQNEVLLSDSKRILLNCCRQSGKTTVVAALVAHELLLTPGSMVVVLSHTQEQAEELFRMVLDFMEPLPNAGIVSRTRSTLTLDSKSRLVCLPCRENSVRGYPHVTLLIIDEAARVPDEVYRAARPMIAAAESGRIVCMSTPAGKQGFFYDSWIGKHGEWFRREIKASEISRISPTFLEEEKLVLGPIWYAQEYCCSFEVPEGAIYPDFASTLTTWNTLPPGERVGGIDFGFGDPFVALWGYRDANDVLWIEGEIYVQEEPLAFIHPRLPRGVLWHADPSKPGEIFDLRRGDHKVYRADNAREAGLGAVAARIRTDRLRVHQDHCPNLIRESALYRYKNKEENPGGKREPKDGNDHAMDALRYLIAGIDHGVMHRLKTGDWREGDKPGLEPVPRKIIRPMPDDPNLWTKL
jgi:hypothetical protein